MKSNNKNIVTLNFWIIMVTILWPLCSWAHVGSSEAGGFLTGLQHPISGFDHVMAMIAVGLWGAQLGTPAVWILPVVFPMMMAMGGNLGLMNIPLPGVETGIAFSAVILGLMVLAEARLKIPLAMVIIAFFAIFHGHAHGTELPTGQSGLLYSIGFVTATGCLHGMGIAIGLVHRWQIGRLVLRGAGSFVCAGGIYYLVRAI